MPRAAVTAVGLGPLRRNLVRAQPQLKRELAEVHRRSRDIVEREARRLAQGNKQLADAFAKGGLKAGGGAAGSTLRLDGAKVPHVLGANFGSGQGPRKRQFRRRAKPDYALYQGLENKRDDVVRELGEGLDRVLRTI